MFKNNQTDQKRLQLGKNARKWPNMTKMTKNEQGDQNYPKSPKVVKNGQNDPKKVKIVQIPTKCQKDQSDKNNRQFFLLGVLRCPPPP